MINATEYGILTFKVKAIIDDAHAVAALGGSAPCQSRLIIEFFQRRAPAASVGDTEDTLALRTHSHHGLVSLVRTMVTIQHDSAHRSASSCKCAVSASRSCAAPTAAQFVFPRSSRCSMQGVRSYVFCFSVLGPGWHNRYFVVEMCFCNLCRRGRCCYCFSVLVDGACTAQSRRMCRVLSSLYTGVTLADMRAARSSRLDDDHSFGPAALLAILRFPAPLSGMSSSDTAIIAGAAASAGGVVVIVLVLAVVVTQ